jgi:hypothetical protein
VREIFPGYFRPSEAEFVDLWKRGCFVFDTSVLLNLYSYPEEVRGVFLSVLEKVAGRSWIPYQAALEFHRNRIPRIKQANQRVERLLQSITNTESELEKEVEAIELEKRNIGLTDIPERLGALRESLNNLREAVQLARDRLPAVSLDDPIRDKLFALLGQRIGPPPAAQADLDEMLRDAQDRYDKGIPPGFSDTKKGTDTHRHRMITYPRQFGDLILWKQLLVHVKKEKLKAVVFVTGDSKEDWWMQDAGRTLGPHPELVEEMHIVGGAQLFWMYSADQFLRHAETYLQAKEVTDEAVDRVKEVAQQTVREAAATAVGAPMAFGEGKRDLRERGSITEPFDERPRRSPLASSFSAWTRMRAIERWLESEHRGSNVVRQKDDFPDFVVEGVGEAHGYDVKHLRSFKEHLFPPSVVNSLLRGYLAVKEGDLHSFTLILIMSEEDATFASDKSWVGEASRRMGALLSKYPAGSMVLGILSEETFEVVAAIHV